MLSDLPVSVCVCTTTIFPRSVAAASKTFKLLEELEGGDNSSYAGSEARELFVNTISD